jgi:hypothetical protein
VQFTFDNVLQNASQDEVYQVRQPAASMLSAQNKTDSLTHALRLHAVPVTVTVQPCPSGSAAMLQACADDLVDTVLDGCNATILAYGQTGAGKTYTMTGGKADYKQRGLIPRSIHKVQASDHALLRTRQSTSDITMCT